VDEVLVHLLIGEVVVHGCFRLHLEATHGGPDVRGGCGATCS